ncbi:MAG: FmdB family zinc ribbon protein [Candidatus Limnocylindrales bacterium]
MPTYDYICSNCGKTTEIVHSINGGPPSACPVCAAEGTLRKSFNPPTIHFKGSGWAKKDRSVARSKAARASESATSPDTGSTKSSPADGASGDTSSGDGASGDAKSGDGASSASAGNSTPETTSAKNDSFAGGDSKAGRNESSSGSAGASRAGSIERSKA